MATGSKGFSRFSGALSSLRRRGVWSLRLLLGCLFAACAESEPLYDSYPVRFLVQHTNTVPELNIALTSTGEFCTIQVQGAQIVYTNLKSSTPTNVTADAPYHSFNFGRGGGFVVGHTDIQASRLPDTVVCYDLVCRNCYAEQASAPPTLQLLPGRRAECPVCLRAYDLNELGMVVRGDKGRPLYRYPVRYTPTYNLEIGNY